MRVCLPTLAQINHQLLGLIKPLLVSALVVGFYHHLTVKPPMEMAVIDVGQAMSQGFSQVVQKDLSDEDNLKAMREYNQAYLSRVQAFAKANNLMIFSKGALLNEVDDLTEGANNVR